MGQGRSSQIQGAGTRFTAKAKDVVTSASFIFDLIEFWIAGVVGIALFASLVATVVHAGLPWECEQHVKFVSGAANLGFNQNHTVGSPDASHYECEYMTSTASFNGHRGSKGMCGDAACDDTMKKTICNAHSESLGCKWYAATDIVSATGVADPQRNWHMCASGTNVLPFDPVTTNSEALVGCCLYNSPTQDDQMHDVCYSIDQYVNDEHYPNFVGKYKTQVEGARVFAILGYVFGYLSFSARFLYHVPVMSNWLGGADYQKSRDYWLRLLDLAFLIAAFIFTILTFTELDDVLMDNRKHLWGTGGVFKTKQHQDLIEEQMVRGTGYYTVVVYATFLGINVVWFLGTQVGIIPNHPTHQDADVELRGIAFRSEHA